jgi:hypothetical protein
MSVVERQMLFGTDMVKPILNLKPNTWPPEPIDPRMPFKWQTRRIVKPQPVYYPDYINPGGYCWKDIHYLTTEQFKKVIPKFSPYQPGDTLWVRETWLEYKGSYLYRADGKHCELDAILGGKSFFKWRPSIHMPREAARLFLPVKNIRVERLQEITEEDARAEGIFPAGEEWEYNCYRDGFIALWNSIYSKPKAVIDHETLEVTHYVSYPWENIQETREYKGKPWLVVGNPWVWVIDFGRKELLEEQVS